MRHPLARDTSRAAEARQIAFFQQRQPHERIAITSDLTAFTVASSRAAIQRAHPALDALRHARLWMALTYGSAYAARIQQPPTIAGILALAAALLPITRTFHALGVRYYIGGSIASTAYSVPRSTYDIDVAADIQLGHVAQLVTALEAEYYIEHTAIVDALLRRDQEASVSITHYATTINLDIFVTPDRPFDTARYQRVQEHLFPGASVPIKLASPEDVVLNKLQWLRQDGIACETHWRDVNSVIRVQDQALDLPYLQRWATTLHMRDLLDAALR